MPSIAIVGAGPGVGHAVARRFGRAGYDVALIARDQAKLDALAADLRADGITARGFAADVRDTAALSRALQDAAEALGPIEVLQYSPLPHRDFLKPVLETTLPDVAAAVEFSVYGPFAAVQQVLGGMRANGRGTIVFVNGGTSVRPRPNYAGTSIAFAGESAYAQMLHDALADENIYVTQLVVPGAITRENPESSPDAVAERIWDLHSGRQGFRHFLTPMDPETPA